MIKIKKINRVFLIIPIMTLLALFTALNINAKVYASEGNVSEKNVNLNDDRVYHPGIKDSYDNNEIVSLNQLPVTGYEKPAPVKFKIIGTTVIADIYFEDKHHAYNVTFDSKTNMELFDNRDTLYINDGDNGPQIFINLDNEREYLWDILSAPEGEKPAFVPHSIWHMKTNDIQTIMTYDAYMYLTSIGGMFYAFYYTDDIAMDKMLSVNMEYSIQIEEKRPWPLKNKMSAPIRRTEFMRDNSLVEYKNRTTPWFLKLSPLLLLIDNKTGGTMFRETKFVPGIEEYTEKEYFLMNEMRNEFKNQDPNFDTSSFGNKKIFKIALEEAVNTGGGFMSFGGEKYHLYNNPNDKNDEHNVKIINIVYETNGKIYESKGSDINLFVGVALKIDAYKRADELAKGDSFADKLRNTVQIVIAVSLGAGGLILAGAVYNSYKDKRRDLR